MAELPRAAFLPDRTVRLAAALLPRTARDRYEREFLSELFGLTTGQQARYALDILIHTSSLRAAVRAEASEASEATMTEAPHRPLTCRLNVHHRWVTKSTEDGGRYEQCRRCGKDRTDVDRRNHDTSAGGAAIGAVGFTGSGGGGF
jgi:hypothetical protein